MELNSYELSRNFFDWSYENPEKVNPNHIALYFFIIEHCNRLGWKEKFGLPTGMAKEAIGIRNYRTYIKTLNDLIEFGFIKLIEKSTNQYSSNIIAIVKNTKATTKAMDKARSKHIQKQVQTIDSIDKQDNNITIEPITEPVKYFKIINHLKITTEENQKLIELGFTQKNINDIYESIENYKDNKKYVSLFLTAKKWLIKDSENNKTNGSVNGETKKHNYEYKYGK